MCKLQTQSKQEWESWWQQAQQIAVFNQRHFFSKEFYKLITIELRNNFVKAFNQVKTTKGNLWRSNRKLLRINKPNNWKNALVLPNEKTKLQALLSLRKIRS